MSKEAYTSVFVQAPPTQEDAAMLAALVRLAVLMHPRSRSSLYTYKGTQAQMVPRRQLCLPLPPRPLRLPRRAITRPPPPSHRLAMESNRQENAQAEAKEAQCDRLLEAQSRRRLSCMQEEEGRRRSISTWLRSSAQ